MSEENEKIPVRVSPEARRALTDKVRDWSGWGADGTLVLGKTDPKVSPWAMCDRGTKTITADIDELLLNPNRVLITLTPFRLRQEAVLTGALLHEAAHARFTRWMPETVERAKDNPLVHRDGSPVSRQTLALAKLMEEARIEGAMASLAPSVGAVNLAWTMRATVAYLLPPTEFTSNSSSAQLVMDVLSSWALRAGRQIARVAWAENTQDVPGWVHQFTSLLFQTIVEHLAGLVDKGADVGPSALVTARKILDKLNEMLEHDDHDGLASTSVDMAREILELLFPETDDPATNQENEDAMPSNPCSGGVQSSEDSEDGDESEDGESDESDEDGDSEDGDSAESEGSDDGQPDNSDSEQVAKLAEALAKMEEASQTADQEEAEDQAAQAPPLEDQTSGSGPGGSLAGSWRTPTPAEREIQKEAERFLRDMIEPTESSKRQLTDQPSSEVDGAALSAWKAGGQVRAPHFFVRTRRLVEPAPPVEIAILVDVSASMDVLQEPSALLSWSLAAAALDLQNFAGRGEQARSCLIHWGDSVRTIQSPGEMIPGIRKVPCIQGTSNMHGALAEVERVIPGFFDAKEKPVNRLLVQFTDWRLQGGELALPWISRALENGVNMLSVVPSNYAPRWASLDDILRLSPIQRGASSLVKYNGNPADVWKQAARALSGAPGQTPPPPGSDMFPAIF